MSARARRGKRNYLAGLNAEDIVARHYQSAGHDLCDQRWRGSTGELDLVARDGEGLIFIEVKSSKNHAQAAERLSGAQIERIWWTASEYLATQPKGQDTASRFDVALVDGMGRLEIVENAIVM